MGCKCKDKKKIKNNKLDLVQLIVEDDEGTYYLIVDKNTSQVLDKCLSKFPDIPLVESVRVAR